MIDLDKMAYSPNKKYYKEIIERWEKGESFTSIYKSLKMKKSTFNYIRRRLQLSRPNVAIKAALSSYDYSIIIGTVLGDASISKGSSRASMLSFSHCIKQKEYFDFKMNKLQKIGCCYNKKESRTTRGKDHGRYSYASKQFEELKELRNIFYPNGKKAIPIDFIKQHFTEESLALMYMDDGNRGYYNTIICTQCFKRENLEEFVKFIKEKFDIEFTIQKKGTIRLKQSDVDKFDALISPTINKVECMKYKLIDKAKKTI